MSATEQRVYFYSLMDKPMGFFAPPFLASSDADAKRMVRDSIEPGSILSRYPADYHLYRLGSMSSVKGIDDGSQECLCSVNDIIRDDVRRPDGEEESVSE